MLTLVQPVATAQCKFRHFFEDTCRLSLKVWFVCLFAVCCLLKGIRGDHVPTVRTQLRPLHAEGHCAGLGDLYRTNQGHPRSSDCGPETAAPSIGRAVDSVRSQLDIVCSALNKLDHVI